MRLSDKLVGLLESSLMILCVARKKRAETEETNGKESWPTVIYCRTSPILVPMGTPNAGVLYNGRSQQTIRIQKRYFDNLTLVNALAREISDAFSPTVTNGPVFCNESRHQISRTFFLASGFLTSFFALSSSSSDDDSSDDDDDDDDSFFTSCLSSTHYFNELIPVMSNRLN